MSIDTVAPQSALHHLHRLESSSSGQTQGASPSDGGGDQDPTQALLQDIDKLLKKILGKLGGADDQGDGPGAGGLSPQLQQELALIAQLWQAMQQQSGDGGDDDGLGLGGGGGGGGGGMPNFGGGGGGASPVGGQVLAQAGGPAAQAAPQGASADVGAQSPPQQPAASAQAGPAASVQPVDGSGGDLSPQQIATRFGQEIGDASKETGIPPGVLAGQIYQESKGKPETPGGGLMQMGDNEFKQYGGGDISNPRDNIMAGARYMKDLSEKFGGNTQAALRAYNSGPNGVDLGNLDSTPAGTGDPTYVQKVMQAGAQSGLSTTTA